MKHRVNWNLYLDSKKEPHKEGDIITVPPQHVKHLESLGVITPVPDVEESDSNLPNSGPVDSTVANLAKSTKDQIAAYAKETFGVELISTELTKEEMLAKVAELAKAQE